MTDQFRCERRQPFVVAFRPPVFDRDIAALGEAGRGKAVAKRVQTAGKPVRRFRAEISDHRHSWLLRKGGARPYRGTAEQRDEIPPPHYLPRHACDIAMIDIISPCAAPTPFARMRRAAAASAFELVLPGFASTAIGG